VDISWLRDLIIVIYGILGIILIIPVFILSIVVYRKIRDLIHSIQQTTNDAKEVIGTVRDEFVNPVSKIMVIFQVIKQTATLVSEFMKKQQQQQEGSNE